jgi:hypothetical protein
MKEDIETPATTTEDEDITIEVILVVIDGGE